MKLSIPKSEEEFQQLKDRLYEETKVALSQNKQPIFKGMLEVAQCDVVILTAIHKLKSNKGSNTAGVDEKTMRTDILNKDFKKVLKEVKNQFQQYTPNMVRRVHILKDNGETRPLGIPTITDRVVQECIRSVLEPICEAQFFEHSYGFRQWRSTEHALSRVTDVVQKTGYHWVIEGDISKFFDTVNHTKLIKILWSFGIQDRRILMMIKAMLRSGVMDEIIKNDLGTPQGGIISPLLANVYLTPFDNFVTREYERKKLRKKYSSGQRSLILRGLSGKPRIKPIPCYLIRYADDWVVVTNSKENAEKLVYKYEKYLRGTLKLTLSTTKTKITNVRSKAIEFLGYKYRQVRGKAQKGYISRTKPIEDKFDKKMIELLKDIKMLKKCKDTETLISDVNIINSKIRGLINYYQVTTWGSESMKKYNQRVRWAAYRAIRRRLGAKSAKGKNKKVDWISANLCTNLLELHSNYTTALPALKYKEHVIGITDLAFIKFQQPTLFNQMETPCTKEGRKRHLTRLRKRPKQFRMDFIFGADAMATRRLLASKKKKKRLYNFEFYLNRAYAFNRDKGKCRICGKEIAPHEIETHHVNPNLTTELVNRVNNLASLHDICHNDMHNSSLTETLLFAKGYTTTSVKKILNFRNKIAMN